MKKAHAHSQKQEFDAIEEYSSTIDHQFQAPLVLFYPFPVVCAHSFALSVADSNNRSRSK